MVGSTGAAGVMDPEAEDEVVEAGVGAMAHGGMSHQGASTMSGVRRGAAMVLGGAEGVVTLGIAGSGSGLRWMILLLVHMGTPPGEGRWGRAQEDQVGQGREGEVQEGCAGAWMSRAVRVCLGWNHWEIGAGHLVLGKTSWAQAADRGDLRLVASRGCGSVGRGSWLGAVDSSRAVVGARVGVVVGAHE